MTTCELFHATEYLETASFFVPYEFFPLHQDIAREGRVVRGDMLARSCMITRLAC